MFEYEIATMRNAELIRQAEAYRRVRQAQRAAAATEGTGQGTDRRAARERFTRAA
ncbi:hypothetical protein [Streptomyces sp. NRRL S-87]|uniref:hypothetical protein n=1 Tax=Streptomyces sp. NRRL S-87 TaxID=1463920 RepID=UPI000A969F8D|nr:hypothetical protein [Streptomyces sp. NRRL S-87]